MLVDPIADMLTRIRNANKARKTKVDVPYTKFLKELAWVLKEFNYLDSYQVKDNDWFKQLELEMPSKRKISSIKRVSKLWCRIYVKRDEIKPVLRGYWISVISTSKWLMAWHQAFKKWLGGEVVCEVY